MQRRSLLYCAAHAAAPLFVPIGANLAAAQTNQPLAAESAGQLGLRKGIRIGVALGSHQLRNGDAIPSLLRRQDLGLVPEWEMKWHALRPTAERRDTSGLDRLAADAQARGVALRGHTLVWHAGMPEWGLVALRSGRGEPLLTEHTSWLADRYRARIDSWDVVNEAIWLPHGESNGMRSSPWLEALGARYVEMAFRIARTYLPTARLVYNDYNIEYEPAKADAVLRLVRSCRDRGAPIDAIGLQSHLFTTRRVVNETALRQFCRTCRSEGIEVLITELDVREADFSLATSIRDDLVSGVVSRYLDTVLAEVVPKEIYFWGLTDSHSWLNLPKYNGENPDGHVNRGLPFDDMLRAKSMWEVLLGRLKRLPDVR